MTSTIPSELDGSRLDRALAQLFPEHSRSFLVRLIDDAHVTLDGRAATKPSLRVAAGQTITLARGDFFGEMALLLSQRRQADVTAISYCLLLVLQDEDFQSLLKGSKEIRSRIDAAASARKKMNEAVQQS